MSWFTESNRYKHFFFAIPIGFVFSVICVIGVACGMEFKDKEHGGEWDWLDLMATILGGIVGQILQLVVISFFIF